MLCIPPTPVVTLVFLFDDQAPPLTFSLLCSTKCVSSSVRMSGKKKDVKKNAVSFQSMLIPAILQSCSFTAASMSSVISIPSSFFTFFSSHSVFLSLCLPISFFTLRMERAPAIHSANYKNPLLFLFLSYIYLFCVFFPTLPLREQQPITMQEVSPYAGYQSKRGWAIATTEQPSK